MKKKKQEQTCLFHRREEGKGKIALLGYKAARSTQRDAHWRPVALDKQLRVESTSDCIQSTNQDIRPFTIPSSSLSLKCHPIPHPLTTMRVSTGKLRRSRKLPPVRAGYGKGESNSDRPRLSRQHPSEHTMETLSSLPLLGSSSLMLVVPNWGTKKRLLEFTV